MVEDEVVMVAIFELLLEVDNLELDWILVLVLLLLFVAKGLRWLECLPIDEASAWFSTSGSAERHLLGASPASVLVLVVTTSGSALSSSAL